jgi:putative DNA primase/helicase
VVIRNTARNAQWQDLVGHARDTPIEQVLGSHISRLKRQGRELVGPCPMCGGTDRFAFHLVEQVWNCRRCGTGGRVVDLAMAMRGCDFRAAVQWLAGETAAAPLRRAPPPPPAPDTPNWKRLWDQAVYPAGTLVEDYLRRRGVLDVVRNGAFGEVLRFHPACPFGPGNSLPAMVALVRAIHGDAPVAIHRTAIERTPDGAIKVSGVRRMALGPIKGGAIKLTDDAEVTTCLGIAPSSAPRRCGR